MKNIFEQLNSLASIENYSRDTKHPDDENHHFELKGKDTTDRTKLNEGDKKNLSKEICSFANTYGGILCFHNGGGKALKSFSSEIEKQLCNQLEKWTQQALEPLFKGMQTKCVDGVILIYIPESVTKPHRATIDKHYYYRHSSSACKMPEIMISSMYRSQDYLYTEATCNIITESNNNQISIFLNIRNLSNIAGTNPKCYLQVFANQHIKGFELQKNQHYGNGFGDVFKTKISTTATRPMLFMASSSPEFSDLILYPQDTVTTYLLSNSTNELYLLKHMIIEFNWMFKETPRQTFIGLYSATDRSFKLIMDNKSHSIAEIIGRYQTLVLADGQGAI